MQHRFAGSSLPKSMTRLITLSLLVSVSLETSGSMGDLTEIFPFLANAHALVADAGRTVTSAEADETGTGMIMLDGTASVDPRGETVFYEWLVDGAQLATGEVAEVTLESGGYEITLVVTDQSGRTASDTVAVAVTAGIPSEFALVIGVSGIGETVPPPGITRYASGTSVSVLALPAEGSRVVRWSGDVDSEDVLTNVVIDRDVSITAEFQPISSDGPPRFFLPWAAGQSL